MSGVQQPAILAQMTHSNVMIQNARGCRQRLHATTAGASNGVQTTGSPLTMCAMQSRAVAVHTLVSTSTAHMMRVLTIACFKLSSVSCTRHRVTALSLQYTEMSVGELWVLNVPLTNHGGSWHLAAVLAFSHAAEGLHLVVLMCPVREVEPRNRHASFQKLLACFHVARDGSQRADDLHSRALLAPDARVTGRSQAQPQHMHHQQSKFTPLPRISGLMRACVGCVAAASAAAARRTFVLQTFDGVPASSASRSS
jgi:hypothetical protein